MRLPDEAHTQEPWQIHEVAADFTLEDVWDLVPLRDLEELPKLATLFASLDPARSSSAAGRMLFALRERLGALFGWDDPDGGLGVRVPTLRERLPADLREGPRGPAFEGTPFSSLYLTRNEWAAEIANRTVHAVLHVGCVPGQAGGFRARMAVLVKPNGFAGRAYMAAIRPFRHLIVYPALLRGIRRAWQTAQAADAEPALEGLGKNGSANAGSRSAAPIKREDVAPSAATREDDVSVAPRAPAGASAHRPGGASR